MPDYNLIYPLQDSYIHNWLVAGPLQQMISAEEITRYQQNYKLITGFASIKGSGVSLPPVDLGNLGEISENNQSLYWRYMTCGNDHFVNLSRYCATPQFQESWASARISLPARQRGRLQMAMKGFAELWVDDQPTPLVCITKLRMCHAEIEIDLEPGDHCLLIRHYQMGVGNTSSFFSIRLPGLHPDSRVIVPVNLERDQYQKRINLERVADSAYLDQYVFGYMDGDRYNQNESIPLKFTNGFLENGQLTFRLQSIQGSIFQEMTQHSAAGLEFELAKLFPLWSGPHQLSITPIAGDYYQKKLQFQQKEYIYIVRSGYSETGVKKDKQHYLEALDDAGKRRNESVFCEIAKMASSQWDKIHWEYVRSAVIRVRRYEEKSVFDLIGLIGIASRYWKKRKLPQDLIVDIEEAILGYPYLDQIGYLSGLESISDGHSGLLSVCEYLAGQLYPNKTFKKCNLAGGQLQAQAENKVTQWIHDRFSYGFRDWESPQAIEGSLTALSHLVDLAQNEEIRGMATVLMDKIFFSLAANTFLGAHGTTHGNCDTASVLSTRLSPISGITRLMWGMGNYNDHVMGVVSLGCCKKYRLPGLIRKIATDPSPVLWSLEKNEVSPQSRLAQVYGQKEVYKVTYRTRDFMLSSAQDYAAGSLGRREHIWQATLGPDAVVFVNHPFITDESDISEPNLWVGNQILPRVAQWGDLLIAIHQLPEEDWLGYTHAYFPLTKFDEHAFQGNWAFARKGNGYLALSALNGFEFIKTGKTAFRELRSTGKDQVWICQMGQALLDVDFMNFQTKILAMDCQDSKGSITLKSIRGDAIRFGWEGAFNVNNQEIPLHWENHIQNSYCIAEHPAQQIEVIYKKEGIRLTI